MGKRTFVNAEYDNKTRFDAGCGRRFFLFDYFD